MPASSPTPPARTLVSLLPALGLTLMLGLAAQNAADLTWLSRWPMGREVFTRVLISGAALAGAVALLQVLGWLFWDRIVPRYSGLRIPGLLRQFVGLLVLVGTLVAVLTQIWGVALPAVLATTGVFGLVLGLALRGTLTDFFSGIALNVEQPFRLDDFILVHTRLRREPIAGLVREINWRSTRILTPEDNLVSVPNSVVATAVVENLSFPSPVSEQEVDIALDWGLPQGVTDALLGAAVTEAWMRGAAAGDKPPKVRICRLDGNGVTWRITYLLDPRRKAKGPARHELLSCVHRHLMLAGLRPVAAGEGALAGRFDGAEPAGIGQGPVFDSFASRRRALDMLPLLDSLTNVERDALAAEMKLRQVDRGGLAIERGQLGRSMFVLVAGVAEVRVIDSAGQAARVAVVGPGESFGEMSLLTGAERSADVVAVLPLVMFEIEPEVLAPLMAARPVLAEALSRKVAAHQQVDARLREPAEVVAAAPLSGPAQIASDIRDFFGL
jgi:CRP-like cAMP-binding protein